MRPKRKDEKKQEEEVDFSTLPPWSAFTVIVEWHPYLSDLKSLFPTSQFFPLSREEIILFSRDRGTIPPELSDSQLTAEILGKALRDKLLNLDVQGRKAKKETIQKYELSEKQRAEAIEKGQVPQDNPIPQSNPSKPDRIYLISGFPRSQEEAECMGRYGHCVHLLMFVKPEASELKAQHQRLLEEYEIRCRQGIDTGPAPIEPGIPENWRYLQNAAWTSPKNSPLRNLMIWSLEFQQNRPQEEEEIKEEEEKKTKKKKGKKEDYKRKEEMKKLEEKKKEEMRKMEEARKLEEAKKKEEEKKKSEDAKKKDEPKKKVTKDEAKLKKEEDLKSDEKPEMIDNTPPDPKKVFIQDLLQRITDLSHLFIKYQNWKEVSQLHPLFPSLLSQDLDPLPATEKVSPQATPEPYRLIADLPSQDDAPRPWDLRVISALLGSNDDLCAGTEYFLASMLQTLMHSQDYITYSYEQSQAVFEEFRGKVSARTESSRDLVEATKIADQCNEAEVTARTLEFDLGVSIWEVERRFLDNLIVPGIGRRMMPGKAEKSYGRRHAEKCQIYPFSSFSIAEFERMMLIKYIEEALEEKTSEKWDLSDREYSEKLSASLLKQVISRALINDPEQVPVYYSRDDSLILILTYLVPSSGSKTFCWEGKWRVRPNYHQWYKYLKAEMPVMDFYDIDEGRVGPIMEKTTVAFPSDGAVITVKEFAVGPRVVSEAQREELYSSRFLTYLVKDNVFFGAREGEIWFHFPDKSRVICESGTLHLGQPGLTVKFSGSEVLQELSSMAFRSELGGEAEINRVITGKGSVIRYLQEGGVQILFANGNVSCLKEGVWTCVNNRGMRQTRGCEQGEAGVCEVDEIPCAEVSDPDTLVRTMMRSDGVTVISYLDGSTITEHADGTKIFSSEAEILIESPAYAPVKVILNEDQGEIFETYMMDGSIVRSSLEHIAVYFCDKSVLRVCGSNVTFVTGETVMKMQQNLQDVEEEMENAGPGVYIGDIYSNKISTRDSNNNYFEVTADGKIRTEVNAINKVSVNPRIFIIENTGEGYELLDTAQMESIKLRTSENPRVYHEGDLEYHCYYTPISTNLLTKGQLPGSILSKYTYSNIFATLKPQRITEQVEENPNFFTLRNFTKHPEFTAEKRERFLEDLARYNDWKLLQNSGRNEFGVEDLRDNNTKASEFHIKLKIFMYRQDISLHSRETFDEFRQKMLDFISEEIHLENLEHERISSEIIIKKREATLVHPSPVFIKTPRIREAPEKIQPEVPESSYRAGGFLNYFISKEGKSFLETHPPLHKPTDTSIKPLPEVNLEDLPPEELKGYETMKNSFNPLASSPNPNARSLESENPFIALDPEIRSKQKYQARPVVLKPVTRPSVFAEVDRLQKLREQAEKDAAEEYSLIKSKNFNVYGNPRPEKPTVNALRTSSPDTAPNAKFILTESATDRRIRTVSQSNRVHIKAPTVQAMRREGTHSVLYRALMKKQSYQEMIETQNMMVSAYTSDPLKRSLQVLPASLRFGVVRVGEVYEMTLMLKNEDNQLLRFSVRQANRREGKVLFRPAPIAPGMFVRVLAEVFVRVPEKIETEFEIATKTEIYKIPVFVNAVSNEEFERVNEEAIRMHGRSVLKPMVKARTFNNSTFRWGESTTSDAVLPKLPRMGN